MLSNDEIENYLLDVGLPFEALRDGMWVIHDEIDYIDNIVVYHTNPVITFRVKLMEAPKGPARAEVFEKLLVLNATSMVSGAYGLEDDAVVIVDTLQSENLDFNEFQAAIDSLTLAVREHYGPLSEIISRHQG